MAWTGIFMMLGSDSDAGYKALCDALLPWSEVETSLFLRQLSICRSYNWSVMHPHGYLPSHV